MFALRSYILFLASVVCAMGYTSFAVASIEEARKLCGDITVANRALAKTAGYDLDLICSGSNNSRVAGATDKSAIPPEQPIQRVTISDGAANVAAAVSPVPVGGVGGGLAASELKPFGYDLFANSPSTFAPAASIPVSSDYVLGPGDTLDILFFGKFNQSYNLEINREGFVNFPQIGPVGLSGMTYGEAKDLLKARINAQMVGTNLSVSMGSLRSMQIFVLGEAFKPGAYTVSSLSTITHALVSSGGVSDIGSLRSIQLKRNGNVITTLDIYDLLLDGDNSGDVRVQAGDIIYIPVVGKLVSVEGQVLRPAIYELKGGETAADLITLAGGFGPKAFRSKSSIRRINDAGFMTVADLDFLKSSALSLELRDGDHITVESIINENKSTVTLAGHVYYPQVFDFNEGMKLSDVITKMGDHKVGLDLTYGILARTDPETGYKSAAHFNLNDLSNNNLDNDILLRDKDVVRLFSIDGNRSGDLNPLINTLRRQERPGEPAKIASIDGARLSGTYPITENMTVRDLIEFAGGIGFDYVDLNYALLVREQTDLDGEITVSNIDLREILSEKVSSANFLIRPKDKIYIFSINQNRAEILSNIVQRLRAQSRFDNPAKVVSVQGTIRFPGTYPLTSDMHLSDLIYAAGGFREFAYDQSAEITRIDLSNTEKAVREILVSRINDFDKSYLEPSDSIGFRTIPEYGENRTITLRGEFVFPGTYSLEKGETLRSVINRAGGFTTEAFVDGSVFLREELRAREQREIDRLVRVLNEDISAQRLTDVNSNVLVNQTQISIQRQAIASLTSSQALGRLVIPLKDIIDLRSDDVLLKNGDQLLVPKFTQEVTVIGEVYRPTSFLFDPKNSRNEYINLSGGFTKNADRRGIYVVKASGEVINQKRGLLMFDLGRFSISPGDTIVVPLDADNDELQGLPLMAQVSTIIYQLALGAAALKTFDN